MDPHGWLPALLLACVAISPAVAQTVSPNSEPLLAAPPAAVREPDLPGQKVFLGKVRSVSDGDTLVVEDAGGYRSKVRLFGVDAPERGGQSRYGQPFAQRSRRNLSDLVYRKRVRVEWHTYDSYGRMIGKVLLDGADVGLRQICDGYAWVYRQYADELPAQDRRQYAQCEQAARAERRGLWRDSRPVPPWEWRHSARNKELEP